MTNTQIRKEIENGKTIFFNRHFVHGNPSDQNFKKHEKTTIMLNIGGSNFVAMKKVGYGFAMESNELAESVQIFECVQGGERKYIIDWVINVKHKVVKNKIKTSTKHSIMTPSELMLFLIDYFYKPDGVKDFFKNGWDDSIAQDLIKHFKYIN